MSARSPRLRARLSGWTERLAASLFFVPTMFVFGGLGLAALLLFLDQLLLDAADLPLLLEPTVDSSRAILTTVASATITVAGIAFSIALLVVQLASSQYSPRVTHGLFRDKFNKRAMGVVLGTFTYCLIVLQNVRDPSGIDATASTLSVSTSAAVILGIVSLLVIVAFIDHNAHMMDVSEILDGISSTTCDRVEQSWELHSDQSTSERSSLPDAQGFRIDCDRDGWVQQIDTSALLATLEPGGTVEIQARAGRFSVAGSTLCTLWPVPEDRDTVREEVRAAFQVGPSRTLQDDLPFGLRQLADVALRALSPGVNDPTTAQDSMFHLVVVLRTMLNRVPPGSVVEGADGRRVLCPVADPEELLDQAFFEIRTSAGEQPKVYLDLLTSLAMLQDALHERPGVSEAISLQADAVVAQSRAANMLERDQRRIVASHAARFGAGDFTG